MNILSMSGGGVKGVMSSRILARLTLAVPNWFSTIDVCAGTSTGGIEALALAAGFTPADLVDLYVHKGPQIFDAPLWRRLLALDELKEPKYSNAGLYSALVEKFGTAMTLRDLKRHVLITSFDCTTWKPVAFTKETHPNLKVVDAAMMTSAAPTYFPPWQNHVDGGMAANNPAMCAYTWERCHGIADDQIRIMRVGTGDATHAPVQAGDWGVIDWLTKGDLMGMFTEGPASWVDAQLGALLGERFCAIGGSCPGAMDDVDAIPALIAAADALDLTTAINWLKG